MSDTLIKRASNLTPYIGQMISIEDEYLEVEGVLESIMYTRARSIETADTMREDSHVVILPSQVTLKIGGKNYTIDDIPVHVWK